MLLTLYVRREPARLRSTGRTQHSAAPADRMARVFSRDESPREQVPLSPWCFSSGPNRRSTRIVHNCWTYRLVWLDDLRLNTDADWHRQIAFLPA